MRLKTSLYKVYRVNTITWWPVLLLAIHITCIAYKSANLLHIRGQQGVARVVVLDHPSEVLLEMAELHGCALQHHYLQYQKRFWTHVCISLQIINYYFLVGPKSVLKTVIDVQFTKIHNKKMWVNKTKLVMIVIKPAALHLVWADWMLCCRADCSHPAPCWSTT